jgi:aminomethyltransferase
MMVCNASNRAKIVGWLQQRLGDHDIKLEDRTESTAMIAVQGPIANKIVAGLASFDPAALPYYTGTSCDLGQPIILTRTGYTGEDGCEIICEATDAETIWSAVYAEAEKAGGGAAGLASRDTLRLEAGMPLYGHELTEETNAAQTDLRFAMQLKNRDFVGKAAIVAAMKDDSLPIRVGLSLEGKRAAREGCRVLLDGQDVGEVVSGTFGPTVQQSISMAYLNPSAAEVGTKVDVDIRGKTQAATVVDLPFYKRALD